MNAAIVLAAGESRRMGRQKALLPYAGTTMVRHIVSVLELSRIDRILVVTGHSPGPVREELAATRAECVHNDAYEKGMLATVRCGLKNLSPETQRVVVALVDQPSISASLTNALLNPIGNVFSIAVPLFGGRRGHPIVFAIEHRDEVMTDFEDVGLRGLLMRHSTRIAEIEWTDSSVLEDIDTPEHYEQAIAQSSNKQL